MLHRSDVSYNKSENGEWVVRQKLNSLSLYSLGGTFEKVIAYFVKERESAEEYYLRPHRASFNCIAESLRDKPVELVFDSIYLDYNSYVVEESPLRIFGTRKPLAEELIALQQYEDNMERSRLKQEREQYEKLRKQFESTGRESTI